MSSWIKFADNKKQNPKNLGLNLEYNGGCTQGRQLGLVRQEQQQKDDGESWGCQAQSLLRRWDAQRCGEMRTEM